MTYRRPTIIDVARRAGVSRSTVSLVLQGSPQLRPATRAAVRAAMADLGYVYNRAAANLRSATTSLIGLVINDLRNPFFAEFATSLQMALSDRGYAVVVANTDEDPGLQARVIRAMIEHGVSALIVSPAYGGDAEALDPIERAGIRVLQVLRRILPTVQGYPFAAPDYLAGGRLAARHLIEVGARRIAFLGGPEDRSVTRERMSGYLDAVGECGQQPLVLAGRSSRAFGQQAAQRLAGEHPDVDAVICFNDLVALGLVSGCARIGRRVGPGFRIVGFDDIEECAQSWPSLSSVRCDITGFGRRIADATVSWLENGEPPPAELRTPVELILRDSSR